MSFAAPKPSQRGRAAPGVARQPHSLFASGSRPNLDKSSSKASTTRLLNQSNAARQASKAPKATAAQSTQPRAPVESSTRVRGTTTLKTSGSSSVGTSTASKHTVAPSKTHPDELQVAAQTCAWSYMASTLDETLEFGRTSARVALERRQDELEADEADIADSRVRYEAERLLEFYDELCDMKVAEELAATILRFKQVEKRVGEVAVQTLRTTSLPLDDNTHVTLYTQLSDTLGVLEAECGQLRQRMHTIISILPLGGKQLPRLLRYLLEIVRGYEENVVSAKEVVQCCRENYRMGVGTLTLVYPQDVRP
ncbi:hypothetical protein BD413DRAFT_526869 [Trametes elegans]|nr:hypothetical protein BD413DRAFT_526869 [Trametes elegans]